MGYIYKITNTITQKIYIGQTILPPEHRFRQHELSAQNTNRNDSHLPLHAAMRKYGLDAFRCEVLEHCDETILNEREIYWIALFDSTNPAKGYNLSLGGGGTSYYKTEELLSLWNQGKGIKEISEVTGMDRGFLSLRLRDAGVSTEEISIRRYAATKESRSFPVHQYSLDGQYLKTFASVQEARTITNIGHIERCCNGNQKQAGGYIWSYIKHDIIPAVKNDNPATRKRKVYQYGLDGFIIKEFKSAYHAEKATGINQTAIRNVCLVRNRTAGGYIWRYNCQPHISVELSKNTGKSKRVAKYDIKTGELIQIYDSLAQAAKENNISSIANITSACTGKYKSCGGFIWKYAD